MPTSANPTVALLPVPKKVEIRPGRCVLSPDCRVDFKFHDERLAQALRAFLETQTSCTHTSNPAVALTVIKDSVQVPQRDGYRLDIRPSAVELVGQSAAGCYHGLQTLRQWAGVDDGTFACGTVTDYPDFITRGLLLDVTRGKTPSLSTLKSLVDRLASLKINQLHLYIEHAFAYSFDQNICKPAQGLTSDEACELHEYAHERFIDLVPAVATLGHMGRILSFPRYKHLAEIETPCSWEKMTWAQRARGLTLDCMSPQSHRLVERIWADILDAFPGPIVNTCGDEPWDLGKGKNKGKLDGDALGRAYFAHIRSIHDFCAAAGRRVQIWGDIARNYPDLLSELPENLTVLHWGYDDDADYGGTAQFVDAGLNTIVCPGTWGWKRVCNAVDAAENNISTFAQTAKNAGATGLLNTDWGDHGHFNHLACSWHGIALGAATAWDAQHPIGTAFDSVLSHVLGMRWDTKIFELLREMTSIAHGCETWRFLYEPIRQNVDDPTLPSMEDTERTRESAERLQTVLADIAMPHCDPLDLAELNCAARFSELLATKVTLVYETKRGQPMQHRCIQPSQWADHLRCAVNEYSSCWRARNKEAGLDDIIRALEMAARDVETAL